MTKREEFEKLLQQIGYSPISVAESMFIAYQSRQPEVDALRAELDARKAALISALNMIGE